MEKLSFPGGDGVMRAARFFRAQQSSAPVVVAIHGGAWRAGSPARYDQIGPYLAAAGISVLAIGYRSAGTDVATKFPAQAADVNAAVNFLASHALDLGVDMARLGLLGDSAGAHLAALYALGAFREDGSPPAKAMVGLYGVYDLLAQFEHDLLHRSADQITENLLGVSAFDDRRAYFEASPISYALRGRRGAAFLIGWGTDDDVVDCSTQSEAFLSALKRAGHVARALPVVGAPHFWVDEPLDDPQSYTAFAMPRVRRFLTANL